MEMENKVYVLDTTILIETPDYMYRGEGTFVIPTSVIKEIDGLKNSDQEDVAKTARKVARTLDRLGSYGNLAGGVRLSTGGTLRVYAKYAEIDDLNSKGDNRIVGAAIALKKEMGSDVELITTDINMRTVARVYGIKADFPDLSSIVRDDTDVEDTAIGVVNDIETNDLKRRTKRAGIIAIASGVTLLVTFFLINLVFRNLEIGNSGTGIKDGDFLNGLFCLSIVSSFWWGGYYFFLRSFIKAKDKTAFEAFDHNNISEIGPKEVFDPRYSGLGCNIYRDE
jgi:rRNA maturation endonuclease Nob1